MMLRTVAGTNAKAAILAKIAADAPPKTNFVEGVPLGLSINFRSSYGCGPGSTDPYCPLLYRNPEWAKDTKIRLSVLNRFPKPQLNCDPRSAAGVDTFCQRTLADVFAPMRIPVHPGVARFVSLTIGRDPVDSRLSQSA